MWSRQKTSPWPTYKQDLLKLNPKVRFAADAVGMLNGARLSVNELYSIVAAEGMIAAEINISSTTALRLADLEGLPSNSIVGPVRGRPLHDEKKNHSEQTRKERLGTILTKKHLLGNKSRCFNRFERLQLR